MKKLISLLVFATGMAAGTFAQQYSLQRIDISEQDLKPVGVRHLPSHSPSLSLSSSSGTKKAPQDTHEASKQLDSIVNRNLSGDPLSKTVYTYDQWGNRCITDTYNWDVQISAWKIGSKDVIMYNKDGNTTLRESYKFTGSSSELECVSRTVYSWGENSEKNWTVEIVYYTYDYLLQQLIPDNKEEIVLDGHSSIYKSQLLYQWVTENNSWLEVNRYFVTNNDDGFDETIANYSLNMDTKVWNAVKEGFSYDSSGNLIKKGTYSNWSSGSMDWGHLSVENIASVVPDFTVNYVRSGTSWLPLEKTEIVGGYTVKYTYENGIFLKQSKELIERNWMDQVVFHSRFDWNTENAAWIQTISRTYEYDSEGNLLYEQFREYSSTGKEIYFHQMYRESVSRPWITNYTWERYRFYDENGLQTYYYTTTFVDGAFKNNIKRSFTYDNDKNLIKDARSDWNGTDWVSSSWSDYYYSGLNNIIATEIKQVGRDGNGSFDLKFNIPTDAVIQTAVFSISLPEGFTFVPAATVLSDELAASCEMQLSYNEDGTPKINIVAKNPAYTFPKVPSVAKLQNIVSIAYKAATNKPIGTYMASIHNASVTFFNNPSLSQQQISITLNITEAVTGTSSISSSAFSISPNPAKDEVIVGGSQGKSLRIYDLNGKQLDEIQLQSNEQKINLSGYLKGVYLLNLVNDGKVTAVEKLVVK